MVMNDNNMQENFDKVRAMFPALFDYTFLDCASHPPLAMPIREKIDAFYDKIQYGPLKDPQTLFDPIESCRKKIAVMVGCAPSEIAIIPNTSYGLNIPSIGLDLKAGESIVMPDNEFPANVYPFVRLRDKGINIKYIPNNNGIIELDEIEKALTGDVKLLTISWVQFHNGARNDLEAIGKLCEANGTFFCVDGIQGAGNIPLNLSETGVHLFSAGAEKWLLTPWGTGFCYLSEKADALIKDYYAGWLGVDWGGDFSVATQFERPYKSGAARFEIGTFPYQKIAAFEIALDILMDTGIENIFEHNRELGDRLIIFLRNNRNFSITSPLEPERRSSIVSFTCEHPGDLYQWLVSKKFVTSFREGAIRVSPHLYNNADDIDALISTLKEYQEKV